MACNFERKRYQDLQTNADAAPGNATLKNQAQSAAKALQSCEGATYQRSSEEAQRAATQAQYKQQAAIAAQYASGQPGKIFHNKLIINITLNFRHFRFLRKKAQKLNMSSPVF